MGQYKEELIPNSLEIHVGQRERQHHRKGVGDHSIVFLPLFCLFVLALGSFFTCSRNAACHESDTG